MCSSAAALSVFLCSLELAGLTTNEQLTINGLAVRNPFSSFHSSFSLLPHTLSFRPGKIFNTAVLLLYAHGHAAH